jgi:transposase InsO family protein
LLNAALRDAFGLGDFIEAAPSLDLIEPVMRKSDVADQRVIAPGWSVGQNELRLHAALAQPERTYPTREDARRDVFDYIEMFYNPKRKHTNNGTLLPVDFEIGLQKQNQAGV